MMLISSEHIYLELPITKQNYLNCQNKCASATHWLHILLQKPWISLVWGFLWIFSCSQLLKRRSVFPRKGRSREQLSFPYFIKERFSHSGRKLEKAAYFRKIDEMELWEKYQKEKNEIRRSLSKSSRQSSTRAMPWVLLLKNTPYLQES